MKKIRNSLFVLSFLSLSLLPSISYSTPEGFCDNCERYHADPLQVERVEIIEVVPHDPNSVGHKVGERIDRIIYHLKDGSERVLEFAKEGGNAALRATQHAAESARNAAGNAAQTVREQTEYVAAKAWLTTKAASAYLKGVATATAESAKGAAETAKTIAELTDLAITSWAEKTVRREEEKNK